MRHEPFETFEQSASIGNYHRELACISFLSAIPVPDGLDSRDGEVFYTSELGIRDSITHTAHFKRRDNTEANTALFPLGLAHHPKDCPLVSSKSLIKAISFPYVVGFLILPFKQRVHPTSLGFWLKQCFVKWEKSRPFNLEALYGHDLILGRCYCYVNQ